MGGELSPYRSSSKEDTMNHGILVGAGFLLGTLGVKALKSEPVSKEAVATVAQGLKVKE